MRVLTKIEIIWFLAYNELISLNHQFMWFHRRGFDGDLYIKRQADAIKKRMELFSEGKLYFEIGGKFLYDGHASRVLPGFDPASKLYIFQQLKEKMDILYCISAPDFAENRMWPGYRSYTDKIEADLSELKRHKLPEPALVFTMYDAQPTVDELAKELGKRGYRIFYRYPIAGYPHDLSQVVSEQGYGKDDYIETEAKLVVVMAAGSNSGKMSTCLGQVYHDAMRGLHSGYAKYETFPIWNLPLEHPVNIAYEAATVDIGDRNLIDPFYEKATGQKAVNYNRDIEAFPLIREMVRRIIKPGNPMENYRSPTDMGINEAGYCLIDDQLCVRAALQEIQRRRGEYEVLYQQQKAPHRWMHRCEELMTRARQYQPH